MVLYFFFYGGGFNGTLDTAPPPSAQAGDKQARILILKQNLRPEQSEHLCCAHHHHAFCRVGVVLVGCWAIPTPPFLPLTRFQLATSLFKWVSPVDWAQKLKSPLWLKKS